MKVSKSSRRSSRISRKRRSASRKSRSRSRRGVSFYCVACRSKVRVAKDKVCVKMVHNKKVGKVPILQAKHKDHMVYRIVKKSEVPKHRSCSRKSRSKSRK